MAPPLSIVDDDADDELWDELLQFVEDGCVIPIVGRDLLAVSRDGRPALLYETLAERLAAALGVEYETKPRPLSLNDVAGRYLAGGGEPEKIYYRLHKLVRGLGTLEVPEPLKRLASIEPFKLFVSTTFDPLLARAIDTVRFGGVEYTDVVAYSPREKHDLPRDYDALEHPMVFQLLGRLSPVPDYVVTEEDALEFVHSLQGTGQPVNLFSALSERPLLIVGCRFPRWLVPFFIRAARRSRLLLARGKTDFIVDSRLREDAQMVGFLRNFKTRTQFFQGHDAIDFVAELHQRWRARTADRQPAPAPATPFEPPNMTPGAVFLSYASEDYAAAQAIADALDAEGLDVWFDRHRLFAGEAFEAKIRRSIERCSLFVPVLSRACVTPERRFFRLEWDQAQRVALTAPASARFIVPVAIDDLPPDHEDIPEKFRAVHWERLPGGQVGPGFVDLIRQLYREHQSRTVVRA
jgi:hypothetical protein